MMEYSPIFKDNQWFLKDTLGNYYPFNFPKGNTGGGGKGVFIQEDGTGVNGLFKTLNFVGLGVTVTNVNGVATITINSGGAIIGGGGTLNRIAKFTPDGTHIGDSLLFDNGTTVQMGGTGAIASAQFAMTSTTQGFLAPRMTTVQIDAIPAPATGLLVYNTSTSLFRYWDGAAWQNIDSQAGGDVSGSGTTNFVTKWTDGATSVIGDSQIFDNGTNVGIGISAGLLSKLHVAGAIRTGVASTTNGSLVFQNSTNANTLTINSGVTSATHSWTLPLAQGAANSFLMNDGTGVLSWNTGAGLFFAQGGNSFGANAVLGTNDAFSLSFETNNVTRSTIDSNGLWGFNTAPVAATQFVFSQTALATGSPTAFLLISGAHTTLTASVESIGVNFNLSATKQFSTGAITSQREVLIQAPTYSFVGASAITTAATLAISGSPIAGANATITRSMALWIQSGRFLMGTSQTTGSQFTIVEDTAGAPLNYQVIILNNSNSSNILFESYNQGTNHVTQQFRYDRGAGQQATFQIRVSNELMSIVDSGNDTGSYIGDWDFKSNTDISRFFISHLRLIGINNPTPTATITATELAVSSGTPSVFLATGAAHTGMTAGTEVIGVNWNLSASKQWATGAIATQREFVIQAPTYAFVGASTITNAATVAITGAPTAGTNATITNQYALWVQSGSIALGNGQTPAASPANMIQLFSVDTDDAASSVGLRTEQAVVTEEVISDRTLKVTINGTIYKICLKA